MKSSKKKKNGSIQLFPSRGYSVFVQKYAQLRIDDDFAHSFPDFLPAEMIIICSSICAVHWKFTLTFVSQIYTIYLYDLVIL